MRVVFNTEAHFDDPASKSRIKYVATGDHAYAFWNGYFGPPALWLETEGGLSDFRFNPLFPEVEEFRQSVNNNDPYVRRHGL
ncbi:unnamed protein product [Eruca vesicaria subsp. sativa]|uniref:Uncharacterized protein n=1 Tax=Eruca vesicaria subsp. sativa TaxID=29727 RepID=A0ABC8INN9_ERUVS|nr:unnamed protein product [Eruca vesicaria subsp. sativa]